jgi:pilus assembly protein CpaE
MATLGVAPEGRRVVRIELAGASEQGRDDIKAVLASLSEPAVEVVETSGKEESSSSEPPDVVMVLFNGNEESMLSCLRSEIERSPRPAVFALLQERSPGLMRRILRLGADELLLLPLDPADLLRALFKVNESRRRAERDGQGEILSFVSMVGGEGVTTLCAHLAMMLRHSVSKRVAAVDLDFQSAGLTTLLGVTPARTIIPLTRVEKELDSIQLESALSKHPSGVYLLAAPKRVEDGELVSHVTVEATLDLMRQLFDFVLVDCSTRIDENAIAAWERSEVLFYVVEQSVVSARSAWRFLDLFERLGIVGVEPRFVLNRYLASHPISEKQIAQMLRRPIYAKIARDEKALERAQFNSRPLWEVAPGSALTRSMEEIAARIAVSGEAPVKAGNFVSRVLSAIGTRNWSAQDEAR